jgi:hypothetical protein
MNYVAIGVAALAQFFFGAVWYTPLFGSLWGKIHGFDVLSKEDQKKMQSTVGPLLGMQFVMTVVTTLVLALFLAVLPADWNAFGLAGFFWIGFVVPTQVSAVLFGETKPNWFVTKIAIMAGASFGCLMIAAAILSAWK